MIQAYILINARPGKEEEVLEKIKEIEGLKVIDYSLVYGEYDIVVKVEVENLEKLRNIIISNIRKIEGVEKTITLISALI